MTASINASSASKSSTSTSRNVSTVRAPERTDTRSSATSARRVSPGNEIDGVPVGDQRDDGMQGHLADHRADDIERRSGGCPAAP